MRYLNFTTFPIINGINLNYSLTKIMMDFPNLESFENIRNF